MKNATEFAGIHSAANLSPSHKASEPYTAPARG